MHYQCYHSYLRDSQLDLLADLVVRSGGWSEACMIGMYIFVPKGHELFVVLMDSTLIRRPRLDYID